MNKSKNAQILLALMVTLSVVPSYARGGGFGGGGGHFGGGGFGGGFDRGGGGGFDRSGGGFDRDGGGFDRGDAGRDAFNSDSFNRGAFAGDNGVRNYGGFGGDNGVRNYGSGFDSLGGARAGAAANINRGDLSGWDHPNFSGNHPLTPADGGWGKIAGNHPVTPDNRPWNSGDWSNRGNQIRNNFDHYNQFNQTNNYSYNRYGGVNGYGGYGWNHAAGFWGYPGAWYPMGWGAATAWTTVGFASLAAFEGLALAGSMGDGDNTTYNVNYQGDTVYVNGQPSGTQTQFYQQAQQLAQVPTVQNYTPSNTDSWQPLGVFSLVQGNQTDSTMVMQLAINKQGIVKGNYYNQITGENSQISGSLDKKTQRVAWSLGTNGNTVFDTSLNNLTKEESPVLVHYGAGNTQKMALVRLNQPPSQPSSPQAT
jgi:hypothetical protein